MILILVEKKSLFHFVPIGFFLSVIKNGFYFKYKCEKAELWTFMIELPNIEYKRFQKLCL